jgi:hypothetical protein
MMASELWNELSASVRNVAAGYRHFDKRGKYFGSKCAAEDAQKRYAGERGTLVSPSVLVEFQGGQVLVLTVPISDHSRAETVRVACQETGLHAEVVWELSLAE